MPKLTRNEWLCFLFVAVAAALRIAAARGELWFDEVWTIHFVQENVDSIADLVLRFKVDNNHVLNSLIVYLSGPQTSPWSYRLPAVAAGVATVPLAGWVQRRRGFGTALAAIVLCSFSYLLVHYSSEARGYAYQMFLMLAAYAALWEAEETGRDRWEYLFAACCILGFLAQPLFVILYLAAQLWTWLPFSRGSRRQLALRAVFRTIVPGLFFAWLYWVNLREMKVGGGMDDPISTVILQTFSLFIGGPFHPPVAYAAAAIAVGVTAAAFWSLRGDRRRASLYAYLIFLMPAVVILLAGRGDIYPRYFAASALFLCLLWSELLGNVHDRLPDGRIWYRVLLAAFVLANGAHVARLIALGRGHYADALRTMATRTPDAHIVALMDHPLRHRFLIDYYSPRVAPGKKFEFSLPSPETIGNAEWILAHDLDPSFAPPPKIDFSEGDVFQLVEFYPYAGLSGWNLGLYRRAQTPATPADETH